MPSTKTDPNENEPSSQNDHDDDHRRGEIDLSSHEDDHSASAITSIETVIVPESNEDDLGHSPREKPSKNGCDDNSAPIESSARRSHHDLNKTQGDIENNTVDVSGQNDVMSGLSSDLRAQPSEDNTRDHPSSQTDGTTSTSSARPGAHAVAGPGFQDSNPPLNRYDSSNLSRQEEGTDIPIASEVTVSGVPFFPQHSEENTSSTVKYLDDLFCKWVCLKCTYRKYLLPSCLKNRPGFSVLVAIVIVVAGSGTAVFLHGQQEVPNIQKEDQFDEIAPPALDSSVNMTDQPFITSTPSWMPSSSPTLLPSLNPSISPTCTPTIFPTNPPSPQPSSSPTFSTAWTQVGADIYGPMANDWAGWSVSLSGDGKRVAMASRKNDGGGTDSGLVQIYEEMEEGSWILIGSVYGRQEKIHFGYDVDMSADGNRIAVGSQDWGILGGYVRILQYNNGSWIRLGDDIEKKSSFDQFGHSVSMSASGNRVAIGSPYNDEGTGHVRVYQYEEDNRSWDQLGDDIMGVDFNGSLGSSVSLSGDGNQVAIGGHYIDGVDGKDSGRVQVFEYKTETWEQIGQNIDGFSKGDAFGYKLSISSDGNRLVVGSFSDSIVRVYNFTDNSWVQLGRDIDFGDWGRRMVSISADGNRIIVGDLFYDGKNGSGSGHIRVFDYDEDSNTWDQMGRGIDGKAAGDRFGGAVSISADGNRIAVGAQFHDGNGDDSGHVRVYDYSRK